MDQKFFRVPFAQSGDRQTIPDATQSSGMVSFPSGWGGDYAKDPTVDANAKPVEREAMNAILYAITNAVRQYQIFGFPEYITPADNGGVAFAYSSAAVVRYRAAANQPFRSYVSIADNNTSVPGADATKWQEFIYREATEQEAIEGSGDTQIITPRRLHDGASYLDEQLKTALTPYLLPIGFIGEWGSVIPPDGWLELNGQEFDTAANPKLALLYPGGRVPDARGRFIRGWANGSSVDPDFDREIGSIQNDSIAKHDHGGGITPRSTWGGHIDGWGNDDAQGFDNYDPANTESSGGDETRPKNLALMYIIKTDRADSTPGVPVPTAIVLTPQSAVVNAGAARQFSAAVLPAIFQSDYPVSWSVGDSSLGNINASGLYTALAGQTGTQTIIASISTGLTQTVTLNQYVFLTSISISAVPSLEVDETYNLAITFTPSNYTEPVDYSSSESQIAGVTNGIVTATGAGIATASVTGRYSGVTASRPVTVTPKIVVEKYLQI
ncbi:tail fiber protein, partial [Pectobacterium polonicum]